MPHLGAVSMGVPRPSLTGDGSVSATVSTWSREGHKDAAISALFAERLAVEMECCVSASAGVHVENASKKDISEIMRTAKKLCQQLSERLRNDKITEESEL